MGHAAFQLKKDAGIWNTANNSFDGTRIYVWSPLVKVPMAVRYAWTRSPMGNHKVNGKPWQPLHSFRTDAWDWPENEDPLQEALTRAQSKERVQAAAERCEYRRMEEAKQAVEILKHCEMLGKNQPQPK